MADIHELLTIRAAADDGNSERAITTIFRETEDNSGIYMPVMAVGAVTGAEVTLTGDLVVDTLGALNNSKVVDPDAASATLPALARGQLTQQLAIVASAGASATVLGAVDATAITASDAPSATVAALLRGVLANQATIIAALGAAADDAGDPTVIGLLKSVAANTAPT